MMQPASRGISIASDILGRVHWWITLDWKKAHKPSHWFSTHSPKQHAGLEFWILVESDKKQKLCVHLPILLQWTYLIRQLGGFSSLDHYDILFLVLVYPTATCQAIHLNLAIVSSDRVGTSRKVAPVNSRFRVHHQIFEAHKEYMFVARFFNDPVRQHLQTFNK